MKKLFIVIFLLVFICCSKNSELQNVERLEFGVIKEESLNENLRNQLGDILGLGSRIEGDRDITLITIKNPDESIVQAVNIRESDVSRFYPVVDNEVLNFEIQGKVTIGESSVVHSYYANDVLLYDVTLEKDTGLVIEYSVNDGAFNTTSGRVDGCGFFCEGGKCVEGVLNFMKDSALGVAAAIGCGALLPECAAGVGLGCAAVALMS